MCKCVKFIFSFCFKVSLFLRVTSKICCQEISFLKNAVNYVMEICERPSPFTKNIVKKEHVQAPFIFHN